MDELRAAVDSVISGRAIGAEFYFLIEAEGTQSIYKADLEEEAQVSLKQAFVESVKDTLWQEELSLLKIATADARLNAIYEYDLETVPPRLDCLSEVLARDDFLEFDSRVSDLSHVKAILVLLGHGAHQLVLYKHLYPIDLFRQDRRILFLGLGQQTRRFERLTGDILRISFTFDFFKLGDKLYVLNLKTLERYFGFHEIIKNVALEGLESIERSELLESTTELAARVEDISFARKLARVARSSPVLNVIPNSDIIQFVKTHPTLKGRLTLSGDGKKLRLATKVAQTLFLKLLNDDFLRSELTKSYYDSLAKDRLDVIA